MAYLLGFIYADGTIENVQESSRTCYLQLTSKDFAFLEGLRDVLGSHHKIQRREPSTFALSNGEKINSSDTYRIRIGSKLIYNDLLLLGLTPKKSLTITFPKIPDSYLSHYIRGYFDGDGTIYLAKNKYPHVTFTSGSKEFLSGLSNNLAKSLDINEKTTYVMAKFRGNPCYQVNYSGTSAKKILRFMYSDLKNAPYLSRKLKIYQDYLSRQA